MEIETVEHIEANAVASFLAKRFASSGLGVVPVPKSYDLQSIEKFMPAPSRFRGTFTTQYVAEFAHYVKANSTAARIFVDAEKMSAQAFLDLGTTSAPEHGEHRAQVTLVAGAEYKALLAINGAQKTQREFAEWVEDWRHVLGARGQNDGNIDVKTAIASIRSLTIEATAKTEHVAENLKASRSAMESVEAKIGGGKVLPAFLVMECVPYAEVGKRRFTCRVGVLTGGKEPTFVLRITQHDLNVEQMGVEFKTLVNAEVQSHGVSVHLGDFSKG